MSSDVTQKSLENKFVFFVCGLNSFDFETDFFLNFVILSFCEKSVSSVNNKETNIL